MFKDAAEFEVHVTVQAAKDRLAELHVWAEPRGWKCLHIVLDRGKSPSQPMLTRRNNGTLTDILAAARATSVELAEGNFSVVRIKVETDCDQADVPTTDEAAQCDVQAGRYFEHHIKLLLPDDADLRALTELARLHAAHLSRNALRRRDDGRSERFVTARCVGVGRATADARLAAMLETLRNAALEIADIEAEYVVFDGNAALDADWLPKD